MKQLDSFITLFNRTIDSTDPTSSKRTWGGILAVAICGMFLVANTVNIASMVFSFSAGWPFKFVIDFHASAKDIVIIGMWEVVSLAGTLLGVTILERKKDNG